MINPIEQVENRIRKQFPDITRKELAERMRMVEDMLRLQEVKSGKDIKQ
jgi:hypothetical protein